jgi:hypothetical protein
LTHVAGTPFGKAFRQQPTITILNITQVPGNFFSSHAQNINSHYLTSAMIRRRYQWYTDGGGPILPEPASSPPFSYTMKIGAIINNEDGYGPVGVDVFKMNNIRQASTHELDWVFSGQPTEREPTKQWFTTQLHLYGIPFKASSRRADLKEILRQAVQAGNVSEF